MDIEQDISAKEFSTSSASSSNCSDHSIDDMAEFIFNPDLGTYAVDADCPIGLVIDFLLTNQANKVDLGKKSTNKPQANNNKQQKKKKGSSSSQAPMDDPNGPLFASIPTIMQWVANISPMEGLWWEILREKYSNKSIQLEEYLGQFTNTFLAKKLSNGEVKYAVKDSVSVLVLPTEDVKNMMLDLSPPLARRQLQLKAALWLLLMRC